MERRNFLKTMIGLSTMPTTLCLAKPLQRSPLYNNSLLIRNNIIINGTFKDWINSIANEIKRLLAIKTTRIGEHEPKSKYSVKVQPCDWDSGKPCLAIEVYMDDKAMGYFSFAKSEYHKNNPKHLWKLLQCRYVDFIWSLNDIEEERLIFLRKFGMYYKFTEKVKPEEKLFYNY